MVGRWGRWLPSLPRLPLSIGVTVLAVGACELDQVDLRGGDERVIVVHAVMRPDRTQQFVVVEQAHDGVLQPNSDGAPLPQDLPQVPVTGAIVTVANLDAPGDPCGAVVRFDARPADRRYFPLPGIYWGPVGCPTMRPGDRLALRVETPDGDIVDGETVVPGFAGATLTHGSLTGPFGVDTLRFNRDRDTLHVSVDGSHFRALHIEVRRVRHPLERISAFDLTLLTFVDSSAVRIPGDIRHLFDRGTGDPTFLGGRHYAVVAGVADSNYFDFIRSRNNTFTGRGFVNRLAGGIGVFGSLVAVSQHVQARAAAEDPREGRYRLTGTIDGVAVDVTLDAYLARAAPAAEASAFVDGGWFSFGTVTASSPIRQFSVDGSWRADTLQFIVPTLWSVGGRAVLVPVVARGIRTPGAPFPVVVVDSTGGVFVNVLGTLTMTQEGN